MDPQVAGQLRVERRGQQRALPDGHDRTVVVASSHGREDLDLRPDLIDPGRPDEYRPEWLARR